MGKIVKFRRKRGRKNPKPVRFHTRGPVYRPKQKSWGQAWRETRPFVLLIALVTLVVIWRTPDLLPLPDLLSTNAQKVDRQFNRCDTGWTSACVVDGDTIKLGEERIRILGIDTPEVRAKCDAEARLADIATDELLAWLNEGPFFMRGRFDEPTDRYGRQLRELYRNEGGFRSYVGEHMIAKGVARRYFGEGRESWCE